MSVESFPEELQRQIAQGLINAEETEHLMDNHCACGEVGKVRRQNTMYVKSIMNWIVACDPCFEEIEAYWAERWADYYAGCL